jgi:hypothetical protein
VVERRQRREAAVEQPIHEPVIEVHTAPIDAATALWEDARPGNRKAVRANPQASQQVEIGLPPVIVVARQCSRAAVSDRPRALIELVPGRATRPVGGDYTFNLIGRRGDSPAEPVGKLDQRLSGRRARLRRKFEANPP